MNLNEMWQAVLGEFELSLSKANFTTWFKNSFLVEIVNDEAVICVPNAFTKAWLEKKYQTPILKALQRLYPSPLRKIQYRIEFRNPNQELTVKFQKVAVQSQDFIKPVTSFSPTNETQNHFGLNPRYTFDSFIVGKGNELAHAAAQAVVQKPGSAYNPLFIYGGVGLGKTHLLQAVGHELLAKNNRIKILYASCERFTNDFIQAVRSGRGKEFKDTYRGVDLLLIDDIQFITGKEGTQEEFFHTFNTLHQANKQIVISSDRPPKAIPSLEHRLRSRFEWGMIADISSPDLETRMAILETKCKEKNFELHRDMILHLANIIQSNVRELEGALTKIIAFHQFKNLRPSLETIKPLLSSFGPGTGKISVTPRHLIQTTAHYFDISIEELLGKSREKRLAVPRQIIMYIMREELKSSYPAIGQELGGRDHTTA
ncbi:chromosomal replication initiator protein DnaA, partial [Candidatus Uhrbacteria bacterium]|nr:chromosomal replication initiator protein DnaA [Candidatus Uhrbacteria bacterium]